MDHGYDYENIKKSLSLLLIKGMTEKTYFTLLNDFKTPAGVFSAIKNDVIPKHHIKKDLLNALKKKDYYRHPDEELQRCTKSGIRIITIDTPEYPQLLREIPLPPPLLYVRGKLNQSIISLGIVGSRKASSYGCGITKKLSIELSCLGISVVSGMASGIDGIAHQAVLDNSGMTIGILGCGIDVIYPKENKKLFKRMWEYGTLISEFPLGTPPLARNFPIRNRIISGLSHGILVIEASLKSGSLITARLALEQGREVFAVPGQISSFNSSGTHWLIKQGAKLVEGICDITEEFPCFLNKKINTIRPQEFSHNTSCLNQNLDEITRKIIELLSKHDMHIDEIKRLLDIETGLLLSKLLELELNGLIVQKPGKIFCLN